MRIPLDVRRVAVSARPPPQSLLARIGGGEDLRTFVFHLFGTQEGGGLDSSPGQPVMGHATISSHLVVNVGRRCHVFRRTRRGNVMRVETGMEVVMEVV